MKNQDSAPLDIDYVRRQFPGLARGWTLFDNAGGTQILARVVDRMNEFLFNYNVQTGGSYALSLAAAESLQAGREAMRLLLNARRAEEIVFAPSTTVALQNLSRSMAASFRPGDEVIVTVTDHESNIGPWMALEHAGVRVLTWSPDRDTLALSLDALEKMLSARTRLVAVTHVSNILGTVNPIAEIARLVHHAGAMICVDSVAFAPHRAIDVTALDVDFLAFSTYKVFGPHFAVLYGKYDRLLALDNLYHYFYGRDKVPAKLEPGNASYELAFGCTGITEYLSALGRQAGADSDPREQIEAAFQLVTEHECVIAEALLCYLRDRPDCRIIGLDRGNDPGRVPTISFLVDGRDSADITRQLDEFSIATRHGDFHARRLGEYLALPAAGGCVRVSMAHYNSIDEVHALTDALEQVLGRVP